MKTSLLSMLSAAALLVVAYSCEPKVKAAEEKASQSKNNPAKENAPQPKAKAPEENASQWLKQFYTDYITKCYTGASGEEINAFQKKNCTAAYFNELRSNEEMDVDPFLNAQDCDTATIKTLRVDKDPQVKDRYVVSYSWSTSESRKDILVTITREQDAFKISHVQ